MTWYYARVRWAVMVEGRGVRQWKESMIVFLAVDRKAAFERALELGRGGNKGKKREEDGWKTGWPRLSSWMTFGTAKRSSWA